MFAAQARRLCGLAAVLCGWRPEEFWRATPQELGDVIAAFAGEMRLDAAMPVDAGALRALMERFPDG